VIDGGIRMPSCRRRRSSRWPSLRARRALSILRARRSCRSPPRWRGSEPQIAEHAAARCWRSPARRARGRASRCSRLVDVLAAAEAPMRRADSTNQRTGEAGRRTTARHHQDRTFQARRPLISSRSRPHQASAPRRSQPGEQNHQRDDEDHPAICSSLTPVPHRSVSRSRRRVLQGGQPGRPAGEEQRPLRRRQALSVRSALQLLQRQARRRTGEVDAHRQPEQSRQRSRSGRAADRGR